jgi:hypothetical protein
MTKMGLTKEQLKLVQEFKDTDEYKQLQYKYIAIRSSGKRASIKDKLIELAKKFVDKYKEKLPKLAYEILVKKFARRFQDYMEDVAKPILVQAKQNKTSCDPAVAEETPTSFSRIRHVSEALRGQQKTTAEIALESISASLAKIASNLGRLADRFEDAMFVKDGDLVDRKTKKPKHVGWSWMHSIHSELAQLRGLTADKKEDEYINTPSTPQPPQYVPVPYQLPYPPPPWTTPSDKPWWQQPESPSYPTITCKNSDTCPPGRQ